MCLDWVLVKRAAAVVGALTDALAGAAGLVWNGCSGAVYACVAIVAQALAVVAVAVVGAVHEARSQVAVTTRPPRLTVALGVHTDTIARALLIGGAWAPLRAVCAMPSLVALAFATVRFAVPIAVAVIDAGVQAAVSTCVAFKAFTFGANALAARVTACVRADCLLTLLACVPRWQ